MQVFKDIESYRRWQEESDESIGFVPTMGALHEGHASLFDVARPRCERLVLSIFVNPAQFSANEDLDSYPKTIESDLKIAEARGVDAVFLPTPEIIYPNGYNTYVNVEEISAPLCGRFRPGHFKGVATVVLKLFNIVRPKVSVFGLKDAQQFFVIDRLARDLDLGVEVVGAETIREENGLAMSSRNRYLSADDLNKASAIYRELTKAKELCESGQPLEEICEAAAQSLQGEGFDVQYFEALQLPSFKPIERRVDDAPILIATAAVFGGARLIDNVIVGKGELEKLGVRFA